MSQVRPAASPFRIPQTQTNERSREDPRRCSNHGIKFALAEKSLTRVTRFAQVAGRTARGSGARDGWELERLGEHLRYSIDGAFGVAFV